MKDFARAFLALVLAAVVLAIILPLAILAYRVAQTWTTDSTGQLLGGALTCLGGMGAIFAAMAGAGVFARFAGWKPPRRDPEDLPGPVILDAPPGWNDRGQLPAPPAAPPWGLTGGGQYELLPPPAQDRRYSMTTEKGGDR